MITQESIPCFCSCPEIDGYALYKGVFHFLFGKTFMVTNKQVKKIKPHFKDSVSVMVKVLIWDLGYPGSNPTSIITLQVMSVCLSYSSVKWE